MSGSSRKKARAETDSHLPEVVDLVMIDLCRKGFGFRFEVAWRIIFKMYKPESHKVEKAQKKIRRNYEKSLSK